MHGTEGGWDFPRAFSPRSFEKAVMVVAEVVTIIYAQAATAAGARTQTESPAGSRQRTLPPGPFALPVGKHGHVTTLFLFEIKRDLPPYLKKQAQAPRYIGASES